MGERRVVLGRISGLFGVRGWVKVYSHTRPAENLLRYERWFLNRGTPGGHDSCGPFRVEQAKPHGKTLIARLVDPDGRVIDDRDTAARLIGADVAVARADMPELAPGEYYWHDLVGLEVINRQGRSLGRVGAMMETGANDVLVVQGDRERLIPFVFGVIIERVDPAAGTISVDWGADF